MHYWITKFNIRDRDDAFPQLYIIGHESQNSIDYHQKYHSGRGVDNYCSFQLTLSGEGVFRDSTGEYRVGAGQGFFFNTKNHDWEYFYPANALEPWEFIYIEFRGANSFDFQKNMVKKHGPIFNLGSNSPEISRLFNYRGKGWNVRTISIMESAETVYSLQSALCASVKPPTGDALDSISEKACIYISNNLGHPLSTETIAKELRISREHLTRTFQQSMGITPYKYILQEKMAFACHLLRNSNLSVKEIAFKTGHTSAEHFSQLFKKIKAVTPGRYRRGL